MLDASLNRSVMLLVILAFMKHETKVASETHLAEAYTQATVTNLPFG